MRPVPWSRIGDWSCSMCGRCCERYTVSLSRQEAIRLASEFGPDVVQLTGSKPILRKLGRKCPFLVRAAGMGICSLQGELKPIACKLWPFKIQTFPKYGRASEALMRYKDLKLYIYVDPTCEGVRAGAPSEHFCHDVLPEFIELALGIRKDQKFSTSTVAKRPEVKWGLINPGNILVQAHRLETTQWDPRCRRTIRNSIGRRAVFD